MSVLRGYWLDSEFRGRTTNWASFAEPTRELHVCLDCGSDLPLQVSKHRRHRLPNGRFERVDVYVCGCGRERWIKTGKAA